MRNVMVVAMMKALKKKRSSCRWRATSEWRRTLFGDKKSSSLWKPESTMPTVKGQGVPYKSKYVHGTLVCLLCKAQVSRTFQKWSWRSSKALRRTATG